MALTISNVLQLPITIFTSAPNMPLLCILPITIYRRSKYESHRFLKAIKLWSCTRFILALGGTTGLYLMQVNNIINYVPLLLESNIQYKVC